MPKDAEPPMMKRLFTTAALCAAALAAPLSPVAAQTADQLSEQELTERFQRQKTRGLVSAPAGADPAAPAPGISFDVQLAPSIAARRPMVWRVTTTGGQPLPASTACFAATSGTFSPAAGASRETITVPRTSASACTGQNFALRVGPDVVPERPLYVVSTPFTVR